MATIDILSLPAAVVPVESGFDLGFGDKDQDEVILQTQREELMAKMAAENQDFCSKQAWWACNTTQTQGACHLNAETTCVPVGSGPTQLRYFDQWKLVFGPIYTNMEKKTKSKRSLSVERNPEPSKPKTTNTNVKLTPPAQIKQTLNTKLFVPKKP